MNLTGLFRNYEVVITEKFIGLRLSGALPSFSCSAILRRTLRDGELCCL